jgi:tRNA (guanine37-N1)-methyltransferase
VDVPSELLSGHHTQIAQWRRNQRIALTADRRPDLVHRARGAGLITAQEERASLALVNASDGER